EREPDLQNALPVGDTGRERVVGDLLDPGAQAGHRVGDEGVLLGREPLAALREGPDHRPPHLEGLLARAVEDDEVGLLAHGGLRGTGGLDGDRTRGGVEGRQRLHRGEGGQCGAPVGVLEQEDRHVRLRVGHVAFRARGRLARYGRHGHEQAGAGESPHDVPLTPGGQGADQARVGLARVAGETALRHLPPPPGHACRVTGGAHGRPAASRASVRVTVPLYRAEPTIAPSTPLDTSPRRVTMSSRVVTPPEATTLARVAAQTSRRSWTFGPASIPSLATSVTT